MLPLTAHKKLLFWNVKFWKIIFFQIFFFMNERDMKWPVSFLFFFLKRLSETSTANTYMGYLWPCRVKVILGPFSAFVSKWPATRKGLMVEWYRLQHGWYFGGSGRTYLGVPLTLKCSMSFWDHPLQLHFSEYIPFSKPYSLYVYDYFSTKRFPYVPCDCLYKRVLLAILEFQI